MSEALLNHLRHAGSSADVVLQSGTVSLNRAELLLRVDAMAQQLRNMKISSAAIYLDNGIEWVVSDLACQLAGLRTVPLPLFFSDEQIRHAISSSGVDALIVDRKTVAAFQDVALIPLLEEPLACTTEIYQLQSNNSALLPPGTQKITFTSGTTGTPKGVCLSAGQQFALANSLASVLDIDQPIHLCVLPLSTLLENLAGLYAPLLSGGRVIAPPLAETGLTGSSGLDIGKLLECIGRNRPNSLILVPEMLNALTVAASAGWKPPESLRFVAVGGGKVSPELLHRARAAGIPAYEGYGLSECASVVSLNVPRADRVGSTGRPLPHVTVSTENGEIIVSGNAFLGYANQPDSWDQETVRSGDLGRIDDDGFIYIEGRLKHQLITSFGRNLSPEWVESELLAGPLLQQVVVIGDERPYCIALVFPRDNSASDQEIDSWIHKANQQLPDYARVLDWYRLPEALNSREGLLTENGRPKRTNIENKYRPIISDMYELNQKVCNQ